MSNFTTPAVDAMIVFITGVYPPSLAGILFSLLSFCLSVCLCALSPVFNSDVLFAEKCIRLVREKLIIFPYGQYIVGICVDIVRFKIEVGFSEKCTKM